MGFLFRCDKIVGLLQGGYNSSGQGASEGGDGGDTWRPENSNELGSCLSPKLNCIDISGSHFVI